MNDQTRPVSRGRAEGWSRQVHFVRRWFRSPIDPKTWRGPRIPRAPTSDEGLPPPRRCARRYPARSFDCHEESYGKGARQAKAFVGEDFVVVVLDDLELLPNEKFLMEHGKHETVVQVRSQYQHAIQASFRAAIERATGRTVIGFASTTSIDEPRFVAEIFKLD